MSRVLTLYFTRDETTFNYESLRSVMDQINVDQSIYLVSARPIRLERYGIRVPNIVVRTKQSWPVPIKIGFSFNVALLKISENIEQYDYIFKVDGDAVLPRDYLYNLISQRPHVAGIGPALLISFVFFKKLMKNKYPINYCDDGYIFALAISNGIWPLRYKGIGDIKIPPIVTLADREYIYGMEYYKWGLPLILLIILPLTRIYLRATGRMKPYQQKSLKAFLYNIVGYIHALIHGEKKYGFHCKYGKMRIIHLYRELMTVQA